MCLVFGRIEERKPEIKCSKRRFNAPGNWFINSVEGSAHLILCRAYGLSIFPFYSLGGKWPFSEPTVKTLSWAPGQPGRRQIGRVWGQPFREIMLGSHPLSSCSASLSPSPPQLWHTHTHTHLGVWKFLPWNNSPWLLGDPWIIKLWFPLWGIQSFKLCFNSCVNQDKPKQMTNFGELLNVFLSLAVLIWLMANESLYIILSYKLCFSNLFHWIECKL